jgi:hypothetical protein
MAGIADIFLGFFGNIFNVIMAVIFLLLGIIAGIFLRPRWGNMVMKILPKDRRFVDFNIREETAISVICDDKKGYPPHRFLKLGLGFIGQTGRFVRRSTTRYLGKEGTAYLWTVEDDRFKRVDGGLPTLLQHIWGEDRYGEMPEDLRQKCETDQIMVTVDLADGLTPEGLRSVSEEDIKREEDRQACETLWAGKRKEERGVLLNYLIVGLAGFGICAVLVLIGVIKAPGGTTVVVPPVNQTGT